MDVAETFRHLIGPDSNEIAWWQMSIRAGLIFLFGLTLVRLAGKRVFGRWGAMDIILSVVIGSNLSRALTGAAPFLQTLAATTVLVLLHAALAALAARVRWIGPGFKGTPACLMSDGRLDEHALRRHGLGRHDFEEALRASGVTDPGQVREAWIERNGGISVIRR